MKALPSLLDLSSGLQPFLLNLRGSRPRAGPAVRPGGPCGPLARHGCRNAWKIRACRVMTISHGLMLARPTCSVRSNSTDEAGPENVAEATAKFQDLHWAYTELEDYYRGRADRTAAAAQPAPQPSGAASGGAAAAGVAAPAGDTAEHSRAVGQPEAQPEPGLGSLGKRFRTRGRSRRTRSRTRTRTRRSTAHKEQPGTQTGLRVVGPDRGRSRRVGRCTQSRARSSSRRSTAMGPQEQPSSATGPRYWTGTGPAGWAAGGAAGAAADPCTHTCSGAPPSYSQPYTHPYPPQYSPQGEAGHA